MQLLRCMMIGEDVSRHVGTLLAFVAFAVVGCRSEMDGYSPDLRYPLRSDSLVLTVPPSVPLSPASSGKLDESIEMFSTLGGTLLRSNSLSTSQQQQLAHALDERFGTPAAPLLNLSIPLSSIAGTSLSPADLTSGSRLYRRSCVQCHGLSGDGRGPTGPWLYPHPRDFRPGVYKLAVGIGKPTVDSLKHVIRTGVPGTSMPVFDAVSPTDLDALVAYVVHLSVRGETESRVMQAMMSPESDDVDDIPSAVDAQSARIWQKWVAAQTPVDLNPSDDVSNINVAESSRRGMTLFNGVAGCASCHVNYGRQEQFRYDVWGVAARVPDLTRGEYRWGSTHDDHARKIRHGIPGAGMPSNPGLTAEQVRDLVAFIRELPYPARLPDDVRASVYP